MTHACARQIKIKGQLVQSIGWKKRTDRRRDTTDFYPRDAMLTRVLAMGLCLSVCVRRSQVSVLTKRLKTELRGFFGTRASFYLSYIVLIANSGICKDKGTSFFLELFPKLQIQKILPQYIDSRNMLSSWFEKERWTLNWTVVVQLSWQYLWAPLSIAVVYHSGHQALSIARLRRAGQLTTADTCIQCESKNKTL